MANNPSETITGAAQLTATDGAENVSEETVGLAEFVNKELGTNYKDDEAALAGLKQTKDYVGRVGQVMPFFDKAKEKGIPTSKLFEAMDQTLNGQVPPQVQPVAEPSNYVTKDELSRQLFFKDNPQYQPYEAIIDAMAAQNKVAPREVVESDQFKSLFDKAKGFDEVQKSKSVLQTNSRLGVAQDSMTKAQEAMQSGDVRKAQDLAVKAVIDTFEGK